MAAGPSLAEGKFWGVEHDVRAVLGVGARRAGPDAPFEARRPRRTATARLALAGVRDPLDAAQWRVLRGGAGAGGAAVGLPNAWHPSDHLPVAAAFRYL